MDFRDAGDGEREPHIAIVFGPGARFHCPEAGCPGAACPLHDTRERVWWHPDFFQYKAFVHAAMPRIRLVRLNRDRMLFAFCDPAILGDGGPLPSTTNQLEGGVNAVVKRMLDHHRGLSEAHMKRCCEWAVYMLAADPDPVSLVAPEHWRAKKENPTGDDGPAPGTEVAVQLPAAGTEAYENGFGIRKGWARRSH